MLCPKAMHILGDILKQPEHSNPIPSVLKKMFRYCLIIKEFLTRDVSHPRHRRKIKGARRNRKSIIGSADKSD